MKNVIIVESPTKSKTIESYMGEDFIVLSSKGHITDLATSGKDGLGVDVENNFKPTYIIDPDKKKLVSELKKKCANNNVFLATDPDREGEAISYHLASVLGLDINSLNRVEFHEITKPAVLEAFNNPRKIDLNLVKSQETRRILDRIIGFKVSKLLQSRIKSKSAGRVQSVALKLVCDLEKEILAFIPTKYYEAEAIFANFKLDLIELNGKKERITDRKILEDLLTRLGDFYLLRNEEKESKRESRPPFTTSTLQQEAANKLGFSSTKTMMVAQRLYEGISIKGEQVGLITYMRTDSTHLSDLFVNACKKYINDSFGPNYIGKVKERKQKLAQNAHEAIRPTYINYIPDEIKNDLTLDEYRLYKLIYNRAVASLMAPAIFTNLKATFKNTDSIWQTSGQRLIFDGYLAISGKGEDDVNKLLPEFKENQPYKANEIKIIDNETKPKPRYTEATLIKDMEDKGIGRPSTYATTMQTLTKRLYVEIKDKKLYPTEQGMLTSQNLDLYFPTIFNVSYTANMEGDLDLIAKGEKDELSELNEFYHDFIDVFNKASLNMTKIEPTKTGEICPVCGSDLVIRKGKYGDFIACSNYPTCKYIKQDEDLDTNIICPNCNKGHLVLKRAMSGRNKGKTFYACNNYPKCKTIFNDKPLNEYCPKCGAIMLEREDGSKYCSKECDKVNEYTAILCPNCNKGHLVKKIATKGFNKGKAFYACDNFPKCKTIYNYEPTTSTCPLCGATMLKKDDKLVCSNSKCQNSGEKETA